MTDDVVVIICANPDCKVAETGRCVEGLETVSCPHYGRARDEDADVSDTNSSEREPGAGISLPPADSLSATLASGLLCEGEGRVIAVVGPSDTGKTSLIASLYDLFQEGALASIDFAGSSTLHAFEQACHDARAASQRGTPHINRTPLGDVRFYHLRLFLSNQGGAVHLLLADRAGEEYVHATNDPTLALDFHEIRRADVLTVLVDGKRMLDVAGRHQIRSEIMMILQSMLDSTVIERPVRLALVLTKSDHVAQAAERARAEGDFSRLCDDVDRVYGARFAEVRRFRIAASPQSDALPRGAGVEDLLNFWLLPRHAALACATPANPGALRIFARIRPAEEAPV